MHMQNCCICTCLSVSFSVRHTSQSQDYTMSTQIEGKNITSRKFRRGPSGVSHRAVNLRLMPDELAQLRIDAAKQDISISALARERYLAGLASEQEA